MEIIRVIGQRTLLIVRVIAGQDAAMEFALQMRRIQPVPKIAVIAAEDFVLKAKRVLMRRRAPVARPVNTSAVTDVRQRRACCPRALKDLFPPQVASVKVSINSVAIAVIAN